MARRTRTTHVVFHTAAWPGDPSAADIDRAHRQRGFAKIGYHFLIRKDGTVETGRAVDEVGAHCRDGGHNHDAVGVCFSGHHNREDWTPAQRAAWLDLAAGLLDRYDVPVEHVIGHREAGARKDCPGTRIDCREVRRELAKHMAGQTGKRAGAPGVSADTSERPTVRRGHRGPAVEALQRALKAAGLYGGRVDGDFGPVTERALRAFQARRGLAADGIAGPRVWAAIDALGL